MNQICNVKVIHENGEPHVILELHTDIYRISQVELIHHDSLNAIHEYKAVMNGGQGQLLVNCSRTPPVICMLGTSEHTIDHHFQDKVIEALNHTTQSVLTRESTNRTMHSTAIYGVRPSHPFSRGG